MAATARKLGYKIHTRDDGAYVITDRGGEVIDIVSYEDALARARGEE